MGSLQSSRSSSENRQSNLLGPSWSEVLATEDTSGLREEGQRDPCLQRQSLTLRLSAIRFRYPSVFFPIS